jgi:uncharacterized membrane protein YqjE
VAYFEESKSWLEKQIGRRFPLAVMIIIAIMLSSYYRFAEATTGLLIVLALIGPAYYKDVGTEKATIQLVPDETMEVKQDG